MDHTGTDRVAICSRFSAATSSRAACCSNAQRIESACEHGVADERAWAELLAKKAAVAATPDNSILHLRIEGQVCEAFMADKGIESKEKTAIPGEAGAGPKPNPEAPGSRRDPEERPVEKKNTKEVKDKMLDKTLADSFPTSDPPSSIPDPSADEAA